MEKLIIRRASQEDVVAISALINELMPYMTLAPDGAGAEQFMLSLAPAAIERYVLDPDYQYWTGWLDGDLAGVAALRGGSHLYHMFVARRYHGRGLARQLWRTVRAASPGEMTVNASLLALPMYEHFGFAATGPRVEQHGIAYVPMKTRPLRGA